MIEHSWPRQAELTSHCHGRRIKSLKDHFNGFDFSYNEIELISMLLSHAHQQVLTHDPRLVEECTCTLILSYSFFAVWLLFLLIFKSQSFNFPHVHSGLKLNWVSLLFLQSQTSDKWTQEYWRAHWTVSSVEAGLDLTLLITEYPAPTPGKQLIQILIRFNWNAWKRDLAPGKSLDC